MPVGNCAAVIHDIGAHARHGPGDRARLQRVTQRADDDATADLGAAPRDIVWCDPSIEGPLLPDWSDDDAPTLDLGGG